MKKHKSQGPYSHLTTHLHILRVDGEIESVIKEVKITGNITVSMNNLPIGSCQEYSFKIPLLPKESSEEM